MMNIDEMVRICVEGDVVTAENAEYLRRNLVVFFEAAEQENAALRERLAVLEAAASQAVTDCIPLLSWVDGDDTAVEMVLNIANSLGAATAEGGE